MSDSQQLKSTKKWSQRIEWQIASPIAYTAIVGLVLVLLFFVFYWIACPAGAGGICQGIRNHPPWVLLSFLLAAPGLLLIWYWRVLHRKLELRNQTAEIRNQQLELQGEEQRARVVSQGQVTQLAAERFARGAELLGSQQIETRLAGIYGLERVGSESKRDHWVVVETLAAFVRQNTGMGVLKEGTVARRGDSLADDIQAALTVLGRRDIEHERSEQVLDLSNTNLRRADLIDARLGRANLKRASLVRANLADADLRESNLNYAELCGDIRGADVDGAARFDLSWLGANLTRADLRGASLSHADLRGAKLREAKLGELEEGSDKGTDLFEANLVWADLNRADLKAARLVGAKLMRVDLSEADLTSANLTKASLAGANLAKTNLTGANLNRCDLSGAKLKTAIGITAKQLESAASLDHAELPSELKLNLQKRRQAAPQATPQSAPQATPQSAPRATPQAASPAEPAKPPASKPE